MVGKIIRQLMVSSLRLSKHDQKIVPPPKVLSQAPESQLEGNASDDADRVQPPLVAVLQEVDRCCCDGRRWRRRAAGDRWQFMGCGGGAPGSGFEIPLPYCGGDGALPSPGTGEDANGARNDPSPASPEPLLDSVRPVKKPFSVTAPLPKLLKVDLVRQRL